MALGSVLGIAGIVLVFWSEFAKLQGDGDTATGAAFTVAAVLLSALGTLAAHRNNEAHLPLWQTMAWGMFYGSMFSFVVALAMGKPFEFELTPGYVLSLLYLAILGSVVAFAAYLTLVRTWARRGRATRASWCPSWRWWSRRRSKASTGTRSRGSASPCRWRAT